jgi:hypothetical protein
VRGDELQKRTRSALPLSPNPRKRKRPTPTSLQGGGAGPWRREGEDAREADDTESLELKSAEPSSAIAIATRTTLPPSDPEINHKNENPPPNFYHVIIGSTRPARIRSSRQHNLGLHDRHILLKMH